MSNQETVADLDAIINNARQKLEQLKQVVSFKLTPGVFYAFNHPQEGIFHYTLRRVGTKRFRWWNVRSARFHNELVPVATSIKNIERQVIKWMQQFSILFLGQV